VKDKVDSVFTEVKHSETVLSKCIAQVWFTTEMLRLTLV